MAKTSKDFTSGPIVKPLITFTIPLVLGNLFQLTYNAVDSMIVGRYIGETALAAVGTSTPLMSFIILLISGLCMGASILMSSQYGSKNYDLLSRQISTTMLSGSIFTIGLSLLFVIFTTPLLRLIQVPEEVIPLSAMYLRIIFFGAIFTFIYNFFANTLRALGDSVTPLLFLIISAVLNVFGDLFFVVALKMGVQGSAISTVLSEALCCLLCILYIQYRIPLLQLGKKWFVFDRSLLSQTISYGSTSAMQQATLQIGKTMIQAMINSRGVAFMAAFTAVNKIDDFAFIPTQNIGHSMTTFIAQNKGAGNTERMGKSFRYGILVELTYAFSLMIVILTLAYPLTSLFIKDPYSEAFVLSAKYLKLMAFLYFMPSLTNGIQGYFRGIGKLKITLASTFMNMAGRIVAVLFFLFVLNTGFNSMAYANAAGWLVMLVFEVPLLFKELRSLNQKKKD